MTDNRLESERLLFRPFEQRDFEAFLAYWNDDRYLRFYEWEKPIEKEARDLFDQLMQWQVLPLTRHQFVVEKKSGGIIGNCGCRVTNPGHEADIGYELNPEMWGRGYGTEMVTRIVQFGHQELGLHRLFACVISENIGSIRILEKLGFQKEAHFHDKEYFKGRYWDEVVYSLLKTGDRK